MGHVVMLEPPPPLLGGGSGAAGHMVTSEPFPAGWRARWHGAHDDARALPHREVGLELWDTWQHRSPSLSSSGPRLVQKLEKWESPLNQSRDKLAQRGQATRELLHILDAGSRLHHFNRPDLFWVCFDSPMGNQKTE
jgi:hypothetical protein